MQKRLFTYPDEVRKEFRFQLDVSGYVVTELPQREQDGRSLDTIRIGWHQPDLGVDLYEWADPFDPIPFVTLLAIAPHGTAVNTLAGILSDVEELLVQCGSELRLVED